MKIVFFSSYPAVPYFALVEAKLAKALQGAGHDILYITPGKEFIEKSNILNETIIRKEFNLPGYDISSILTDTDRMEIKKTLESVTAHNFENLRVENLPVGKIALYEFIINHKKINAVITEDEWPECRGHIHNTLISLFACRTILAQEKPDAVLMYNTLYSVNAIWQKYATSQNVPAYFLHHGYNLSDRDNKLLVGKHTTFDHIRVLKEEMWPQISHIPTSHTLAQYSTNHFLSLLQAKTHLVFSAPKSSEVVDIRKKFGIRSEQKLVVAVMSSYDEIFAGEYVEALNKEKNPVFDSQLDWITSSIRYVKEHPELFLIIRVHPRDFQKNKYGKKSPHAEILEKTFTDLPSNIKVNWPNDTISMYDLAEEMDVLLSGWSMVGMEMSMLGIPVVMYSDRVMFYPRDLNYVAKNQADYFHLIELALREGWQFEKIKKTYRWLSLHHSRATIALRQQKKEDQSSPKNSRGTFRFSALVHTIFNMVPKNIKPLIKNSIGKLFGVEEGAELRNTCRIQVKEHIHIEKVETMLRTKADAMVIVSDILDESSPTAKEEERIIRQELQRIYDALYPHSDTNQYIQSGSLQANLRTACHLI